MSLTMLRWTSRLSYWQFWIVLHLGNEDTLYDRIFLRRPHNQGPACNMMIFLTVALSTHNISCKEILLLIASLVETFWKYFRNDYFVLKQRFDFLAFLITYVICHCYVFIICNGKNLPCIQSPEKRACKKIFNKNY